MGRIIVHIESDRVYASGVVALLEATPCDASIWSRSLDPRVGPEDVLLVAAEEVPAFFEREREPRRQILRLTAPRIRRVCRMGRALSRGESSGVRSRWME